MIRPLAILASLCVSSPCLAAAPAAETILFVGNSFTYGANSSVMTMGADRVTDLNGEGIGGVPALFARFAEEAGLDYRVSLETSPGKSLAWHLANRRALLDRRWDHVVLQDFTTLDAALPGDPTRLITDTATLVRLFAMRNPAVSIRLTATWSRPDLVFRPGSRWSGTAIGRMANDLRAGYDRAARGDRHVAGVVPVGQAFTCAIHTRVADANPYDGIAFGQLPLWSWDQYHASAYGYYLEALMVFGSVTGRDPTTLGRTEKAAAELGFSPDETAALQSVAHDALATDGGCGR